MEYFEEYNDDEENRILPLLGDKIVLECWCKWFKNKYFTENRNYMFSSNKIEKVST